MTDIPVIYFNGAKSAATAGLGYSIELFRSNNMTESSDLVGVLYMDVFSAYALFQMLEKDLKTYSDTFGVTVPELLEKLREQSHKDQ